MTLRQLLKCYSEEYIAVRRPDTATHSASQVAVITRTMLAHPTGAPLAFGDWLLADIKPATLEKFRSARLPKAKVGVNRNLALLRSTFSWAVREELIAATPFKRGSETVVRLGPETERWRRLEPGEGDKLLAACGPNLRPLVEALLETGCRRGEILSLQWKQVRLDDRGEIFLPAGKTKTRRDRRIPISSRLRAILTMRRYDADGKEHSPEAYVFGDVGTGLPLRSFTRSWESAVLRAHGVTPAYVCEVKNGRKVWTSKLTPKCRAEYHRIGLHVHDLRREAGSRWLESGVVPLTTIQAWLGHASLTQTATYLRAQTMGQNSVMSRFDEQQARLSQLVTDAETGGQGMAQEGMPRDAGARKSTARHQVQ
jgi:integrase